MSRVLCREKTHAGRAVAADPGGEPKSVPSSEDNGFWSGRSVVRKEFPRPIKADNQGHQQGDLRREVAGVVVDGDDRCLNRRGMAGDLFRKLGVAHDLSVVLQSRRDLFLLGGRDDLAALGHLREAYDSAASLSPPAMARPKERPKEPAAEFTPAASLTRSSSTGARV